MAEKEIIQELFKKLDDAVNNFNESIPDLQKQISYEVELLVKDLDITQGNIKVSVANLKRIATFKSRVEKIIKDSGYSDKVKDFIDAFNEVALLQNQYFTQISEDFTPSKLLEEIKNQAIQSTIESLTESGLNANLIQPVQDILTKNATTGGSYAEMVNQLRTYINGNKLGDGALERYAKVITTDSLNQFSGQYMNAVTNDLGLDWFMYDGAIIKTSRAWCEACVKKKYIHRSEFADLLKGDFPEFKEEKGNIYDKTGLPDGMVKGTNTSNLTVYRGGYNCNHQFIPVSARVVPDSVKNLINA